MGINILDIKPHQVSRDLKGYTILFYGAPKTGKTTIASKFPNSLLLAFEAGFLTIPGVMAQPIQKWSEFKQVLKQLKTDEAKETFDNIIVDTADIAYSLCEKYVCAMNGVQKIGDIPYGGGYSQCKQEFDEALRSIPMEGFGLVMISHSQDKTFTDADGREYNQIVPTLANQPRLIVDRMSDIIGFANPELDESGKTYTRLYMRGTPRYVAGSRFTHTPESIEFTYDNLVAAISDAIDKEAGEYDNQFVTDAPQNAYAEQTELDFDALMQKFKTMSTALQKNTGSDFAIKWAPFIVSLTDKYLGTGKKISDATPTQVESIAMIVDDLEDEMGKGL